MQRLVSFIDDNRWRAIAFGNRCQQLVIGVGKLRSAASRRLFHLPVAASRTQWHGVRRARRFPANIDACLLVQICKQFLVQLDGFRFAQEESAIGAQRVVKNLKYAALHIAVEVDQKIAAADEIDARKRRIFNDILNREHHVLAQRLLDLVGATGVLEVSFAHRLWQGFHRCVRIVAVAGKCQRIGVQVGGENQKVGTKPFFSHNLRDQHGDAVRFFAGGTGRYPDTNHAIAARLIDHLLELDAQEFKSLRITEEGSDRDQHVLGQLLGLFPIDAHHLRVVIQRRELVQGHAPR